MTVSRWFKPFLPLMLVTMLVVTGCSSAPSKYDQVQDDTTGFNAPAAVEKGAEQGSQFNQFFPTSEGDFKVVPSQEKKGFAEYKLKRDGATLAMLTINDTISLPAAAKKYEDATESLAGFPLVEQGTTATGLLVNGRYQVKVLSRSDGFTASDRATWLEKFDLDGLAELEANTKAFRRVQKKRATAAEKAATPSAPAQQSAGVTNSAATDIPKATTDPTAPTAASPKTPITKPVTAPSPRSAPAPVEPVPASPAVKPTPIPEEAATATPESSAPDATAETESANSSTPETAAPTTGSNSTLETSPFLVPTPAS
ncbi:hypothetical protein [Halomicronema sp. CCY15110]|uniref:hypothetical protein n=1 Tax=Halomicronema sp. CCY15110 TaxID=2767773 RepID=UPI001EF1EF3A|nr:hypothetical protein [Halomicronema sp. CCY15110]